MKFGSYFAFYYLVVWLQTLEEISPLNFLSVTFTLAPICHSNSAQKHKTEFLFPAARAKTHEKTFKTQIFSFFLCDSFEKL